MICSSGDTEKRLNVRTEASLIKAHIGERGIISIVIDIPQGSYIYANPKGPGTGKATEIVPEQAEGIVFCKPEYPAGKAHKNSWEQEAVYIYEKSLKAALPFAVSENAKAGRRNISVRTEALVCTADSCTPVSQELLLAMEILENTGAGAITEAEKALSDMENVSPAEEKFSPIYDVTSGIRGILQAVIIGFIAGLILNFMPCVLPVISLKVLGLVQNADGNRGRLLKYGISFGMGIMAVFVLLASMAAFAGYGWGSLFQHKAFLAAMTAVVFSLALSLLGVFTINAPSAAGKAEAFLGRQNKANAFFKGVLAALLATPCSGPFLGGVLAWAFGAGAAALFAVFISVGAGMAAPYILLCAFPALIRKIPKPGEWLITFERTMGFLLMFTVLYLLSVFRADDVLPMLAFLLFLAAALSVWGKYGAAYRKKRERIKAALAAAGLICAGLCVSFCFLQGPKNAHGEEQALTERLAENREHGRVSIVEFTADWCPNCRLVEAFSLNTDRVRAAVKKANADFIIADITLPDSEAQRLLEELGSRSIPFLAFFPAGKGFSRPICLRDIYSEDEVLAALGKASGANEGP